MWLEVVPLERNGERHFLFNIMKKQELKTTKKELSIIDEQAFIQSDTVKRGGGAVYNVRLDKDSYIILFEGRRGAGKTTLMTFYVVRSVIKYNMRVVSNYPIEFMLRRHRPDGKTYLQHVKAEELDFEKLFLRDEDYKNLVICVDEAPDIISHMASLSWRNRLINAFVRQIRKNSNTLFMAAQNENWIDKSMRFQIDNRYACVDAAKQLGERPDLENGEMIWVTQYDESGQWTGKSTEDRRRMGKPPWVQKKKYFPRILWGDDGHEPVFNSWFQIDLLDSLRRVEVKLNTIKISDGENGNGHSCPVSEKVLVSALSAIEQIFYKNQEATDIIQKDFYGSQSLTDGEKKNLGKILEKFNIERWRDNSNGKRYMSFRDFELAGLRDYVNSVTQSG